VTRLAPGEALTPATGGWRYLSFAVHDLTEPMSVGGPGVETAIVSVAGAAFRVGDFELPGRASVWDGLP
jgi:hypothetical protein